MKLSGKLLSSFAVGMTAIGLTLASAAAALLPPIALNAGDEYRIAFVTSTARDATSSDIADYNDFVTSVANTNLDLTALGTTWTAIASTATVDAQDNTETNPLLNGSGVAIYNTFGDKIADSNADLWDGNIESPILYNEDGIFTSNQVWTGTTVSGTANAINFLGSGTNLVEIGHSLQFGTAWIDAFIIDLASNSNTLYALSGTLTVPSVVPLPAAFPLYGAGLAVIGFMGWRRKRKI